MSELQPRRERSKVKFEYANENFSSGEDPSKIKILPKELEKKVKKEIERKTTLESINIEDPKYIDIYEDFYRALGDEIILQGKKCVVNAINNITNSKAYFKKKNIVDGAMRLAYREVEEKYLEMKEFKPYIEWIVNTYPFVEIDRNVYTTIEMISAEDLILNLATEKDPIYKQNMDLIKKAIEAKKGISDEQAAAVYAAADSENRVTVIEGTAGAGKSFTMEAVKEIYMDAGYQVMGTALGWAAAKVLGESAKLLDANCRAIEGLTREWVAARLNGVDPFQGPTLIIVDEAGMVGTKHMATILEETKRSKHPVKIVLTGDSLQVVPVAAGNALELIIEFCGTTRIETIRRQHQFTHRAAVKKFSEQISGEAIKYFLHQECIHWCKDKDMLLNMVVQKYVSYKIANPNKKSLVITLSNADVLELNFRIRAAYKKLGLIGKDDIRISVNNGIETFETDFSVGDEVLLRANDKNLMVYEIDNEASTVDETDWVPMKLGVFNRNSGRIVGIRRSKNPVGSYDFIVDLGGDSPGRVIVNSEKFKSPEKSGMPMMHNYAGTIYGSQGQTVAQVFLIDSPRMDFRLSYVGASRHKESLDIFLDETELHRRLDNTVGNRMDFQSYNKMRKEGKKIEDVAVEIGRYSRGAMLQAVSLCWGKYSENLTATLYERFKRIGKSKAGADLKKNAIISSVKKGEMVIDFLPEYNVNYPLVDVEKILQLPNPVMESELVRDSDAEINRNNSGIQKMPSDADKTHLPMPYKFSPRRKDAGKLPTKKGEDEETFLGKAYSFLFGGSKSDDEETQQVPANERFGNNNRLRQEDPKNAFEDLELDVAENKEAEEKKTIKEKLISKMTKWLNPKPKIEIPYMESSKPVGRVIIPEFDKEIDTKQRWEGVIDPRPHYIDFDGVPCVANVEGGPDQEWIAKKKDEYWSIGRFAEPRIIARSQDGDIAARYRLNGECVVGCGEIPLIGNAYGNKDTPVYIVAGAKEFLWLRQTMEEKYSQEGTDVRKMPHLIWAAKDVDWNLVSGALRRTKSVVIVRSKADDRQIPWALDLQRILFERYKVETVISPKLPENIPDEVLNSKDYLQVKSTVVDSNDLNANQNDKCNKNNGNSNVSQNAGPPPLPKIKM